MSRAYRARRKVKRRQGQTESEAVANSRFSQSRRSLVLLPIVAIIAIFTVVGILHFGSSSGLNRKRVQQEVTTLLSGIPQHGTTLGSSKAPMTVRVYADLECPTVKSFVTSYLPSIIKTWVRDGRVKIEYRSLRTDTYDERIFFEQEAAALAAGRQNKMWNYALTFIHEQGQTHTNYANGEFLTDIALQVPGLGRTRWQHDRKDALLAKQVALELHSADADELQFTPSFRLIFRNSDRQTLSSGTESAREEVETFLSATVTALSEEASGDVPTLGSPGTQ